MSPLQNNLARAIIQRVHSVFQAHALLNLILTIILLNGYYNVPFIDEKTKSKLNNLSTTNNSNHRIQTQVWLISKPGALNYVLHYTTQFSSDKDSSNQLSLKNGKRQSAEGRSCTPETQIWLKWQATTRMICGTCRIAWKFPDSFCQAAGKDWTLFSQACWVTRTPKPL